MTDTSFLTEKQAANVLQISPRYLKKLRLEGKIDFVAFGGGTTKIGCVRYTHKNLLDFAQKNTRRAS